LAIDTIINPGKALPKGWRREMSKSKGVPYFFHNGKKASVYTIDEVQAKEREWAATNK
jgi:hypothetical protein